MLEAATTLIPIHYLALEVDVEGAIGPFIIFILFIGMIITLMIPIFAIPYIFIKMGSVAAKIQTAGSKFGKKATQNTALGQAMKQRQGIRSQVRTERGRKLLGRAGSTVGGGFRKDSRSAYAGFVEAQRQNEVKQGHSAIEGANITDAGELNQLARGDTVRGVRSTAAVQRAAVQKLIQANHADELTDLFQSSDTSVRQAARNEVQQSYSTVSGFAAHLTKVSESDVAAGPVGTTKLQDYAAQELAKAKPEKASTQDPLTWRLAAAGAARLSAPELTALQHTTGQLVGPNANPQLSKNLKPESAGYAASI